MLYFMMTLLAVAAKRWVWGMTGGRRLIPVIQMWSIDLSGKHDENNGFKEEQAKCFEEMID